jgi:hypothetical protein
MLSELEHTDSEPNIRLTYQTNAHRLRQQYNKEVKEQQNGCLEAI